MDRAQLITNHWPLAQKIARAMARRFPHRRDDLIATAYTTLLEVLDKTNEHTNLEGFIAKSVRYACLRFLKNDHLIRTPVNNKKKLNYQTLTVDIELPDITAQALNLKETEGKLTASERRLVDSIIANMRVTREGKTICNYRSVASDLGLPEREVYYAIYRLREELHES